jgi:hypothetical protein
VGGVRLLAIMLEIPDTMNQVKLLGTPIINDGKIMDVKTEGATTTILVDPNPAYSETDISVPITCTAGPAEIEVRVLRSSDGGDESFEVSLTDRYYDPPPPANPPPDGG